MPIPELYHTCHKMLKELRPEERVTRIRNLSWLMYGLYKSRSVPLAWTWVKGSRGHSTSQC
jgi:hypothetical protein